MSTRLTSLSTLWRQRSRREQAYLAVMLLSLGVFAYWFALVAPLRSLAADAERRHGVALAAQARLPAVLAELAQRPHAPAAPADAAALVRSAESAGMTVSVDTAPAPGRTLLRFEAVPAQALFAWLSGLRENQGLQPLQASFRRGAAGVDGEVSFATAAP